MHLLIFAKVFIGSLPWVEVPDSGTKISFSMYVHSFETKFLASITNASFAQNSEPDFV
jgi:hypothetical protein